MELIKKLEESTGTRCIMHFIGIGGIGMSGIATILHKLGYKIQGSDSSPNANTKKLAKMNIKIFPTHQAENIRGCQYIITSSAIKSDNVELLEAQKLGLIIVSRAEILSEIMKLKLSIAVSGSHGKTTTTSLITAAFESANLKPSMLVGGIVNSCNSNALFNEGSYLITEADESDDTFTQIPYAIAVITNIDQEHINFYGSFEKLIESFRKFIKNIPFYGFAVVCIDDLITRQIASEIKNKKILTYGIESDDAMVRAIDIINHGYFSTYTAVIKNKHQTITIEDILVPIPGIHNVLNSLAAVTIATELDFKGIEIKSIFQNFKGVNRRFTNLGTYLGTIVIDDYAHHPSEIKCTLKTAKETIKINSSKQGILEPNQGKLIAILQPHRYSRLESLFEEFIESLEEADSIYITPVYAAGEQQPKEYQELKLVEALKMRYKKKNVEFVKNLNDFKDLSKKIIKVSDMVVFLGAGSITNWAAELCNK